MTESRHDTGVLMALLSRLEKRRIPTALALKDKVDRGDLLNNYDQKFMMKVRTDLTKTAALLARHPQYQNLVDSMTQLYNEISEKALENEDRSG